MVYVYSTPGVKPDTTMLPVSEVTSRGASPPWLGRTPSWMEGSRSNMKDGCCRAPRGCRYTHTARAPLHTHPGLCLGWATRWGLTSVILQLTGECLPLARGPFIIEMSLQLFDEEPSGTYQQSTGKKSPGLCLSRVPHTQLTFQLLPATLTLGNEKHVPMKRVPNFKSPGNIIKQYSIQEKFFIVSVGSKTLNDIIKGNLKRCAGGLHEKNSSI